MPLGQKPGFSISLCRANFAECPAPHGPGFVTVLVTKVTAATCVKTLPSTAAPVCSVIDADARIFPRKRVPPTVAESWTLRRCAGCKGPWIGGEAATCQRLAFQVLGPVGNRGRIDARGREIACWGKGSHHCLLHRRRPLRFTGVVPGPVTVVPVLIVEGSTPE
jgi:hypothetical protein